MPKSGKPSTETQNSSEEYKVGGLRYTDPRSPSIPRIPGLSKLERKFYDKLASLHVVISKTRPTKVTLCWYIGKTGDVVTLLWGEKIHNPMSGDTSVSIWRERVDISELKEYI